MLLGGCATCLSSEAPMCPKKETADSNVNLSVKLFEDIKIGYENSGGKNKRKDVIIKHL